MSSLPTWGKVAIAAALAAIVVVIVRTKAAQAEEEAWALLAHPDYKLNTVASLESIRDRAEGSSVEPWVSYQLAAKLFEDGGEENFARAEQVSQETLDRHPDHAVSPLLRQLLESISSYEVVPPAQG